jgi:hypothetical protein
MSALYGTFKYHCSSSTPSQLRNPTLTRAQETAKAHGATVLSTPTLGRRVGVLSMKPDDAEGEALSG